MIPSISLWSQKSQTETHLYDSSNPGKWLELSVHASVGLSTITQNYVSAVPGLSDFMLSPGCRAGAGLDVRFDINKSFGLATGMDFHFNYFRYAMSLVDYSSGSISSIYARNSYNTLTVPVYLSWRFHIGHSMAWNIDAGVYFVNGLNGNLKASGYLSGENSIGQPVVNHANYETKYYSNTQSLINGVKRSDYGPRIATGLLYRQHYSLNAILQIGARNLAVNQGALDIKYHNISFDFQVGYIF